MHADAAHVVVNLARQIRPGEVVFTGANSIVATAACLLAKRAYPVAFTHINVAGGVDARPPYLPASSGDPLLLRGSAAIFSNEDFFDLCLRKRVDLAFLGAAQIDALGHTNVSAIGDWHAPDVRLPGGGGAAAMMPTARRAVVWQTAHSPSRLVERVDFRTAGRAETLVTPLAVFSRAGDERFRLGSHRDDVSLADVTDRTGFEFDASAAVPTPPPTAAEVHELESLDALGVLERVFGGQRAGLGRTAVPDESPVAGC